MTLVVFENALGKMLWDYMFNKSDHGDYTFKEKEYTKLLKDSSYLRDHFSTAVVGGLLKVYKSALVMSYAPNIAVGIIGVTAAFILIRAHREAKTP